MSRQDLISTLEKAASPDLQGHKAIQKAVELYEIIYNKLSPDKLDSILKLAERIRINSLKDNEALPELENIVEITPRDLVMSDFLVSRTAYWVQTIREDMFGVSEPPFDDDLESALSWLETTARIDMESKNPVAASAKKEISKIADQEETRVPFIMRDLFMPAKNNVKSLWVQPGTLLYNLSRKVDNIANATGFKRHAVTVYILTGLAPILPRVNIDLDLGRAEMPVKGSDNEALILAKRSLKIEINTADLSPRELKMIYDQYRKELKIRKTKSLSDEQIRLFYLVYNRGGPPRKGAKAFWEDIKKEWNSNPANKPYTSWEGVYQRFKIVEEKMDGLFFQN